MNRAIENAVFVNKDEFAENGIWELDTWGDKLAGVELFEKGNVHPHYAAT